MKIFIFSLLLLLISSLAHVKASGFKIGNRIDSAKISGNLTVRCVGNGMNDIANHFCKALVVEPATHSYFIGPAKIRANRVKIISEWENGKTIKKEKIYNSKKGRTKRRVNLFVKSLIQRPLLNIGNNIIKFEMYNNKQRVSQGQFNFKVVEGPSRRCRPRSITTSGHDFCRNAIRACDEYFYIENNCLY